MKTRREFLKSLGFVSASMALVAAMPGKALSMLGVAKTDRKAVCYGNADGYTLNVNGLGAKEIKPINRQSSDFDKDFTRRLAKVFIDAYEKEGVLNKSVRTTLLK